MNDLFASFFSISKLPGNWEPMKAPLHAIIIAAVFTIVSISGYSLPYGSWLTINILIFLIISACVFLTVITPVVDNQEFRRGFLLALSIGVASAVACFFITGEVVLKNGALFRLVLFPCSVQIVTFLLLIFQSIKQEEKKLRSENDVAGKNALSLAPNFIQLCYISTSFLLGIAFNLKNSNLSEHQPAQVNFHKIELIRNEIIPEFYQQTTEKNDLIGEFLSKAFGIKEQKYEIPDVERVIRHRIINQFFICIWFICILLWFVAIYALINRKTLPGQ